VVKDKLERPRAGELGMSKSVQCDCVILFTPRDALHSAAFAAVQCPSNVGLSVHHTPVLCLNG